MTRRRTPWLGAMPVAPPAAAIAALLLALGGCSPQSEPQNEAASLAPTAPVDAAARQAATGEVPAPLLDAILEDLVEQEGIERDAIDVERAESVIWPDGSLGCPQPGVMYTQAQVPGYWVVLRWRDKSYDYRASEKGQFQRCRGSFKLQLPVG